MDSQGEVLHMLFFPLMAPGHMIPMVDMAKLFAVRGAKVTILTTPANAPLIQSTVDRTSKSTCHPIQILLIQFPSVVAGLPEGCENLATVPTMALHPIFLNGLSMLREKFDQVLRDLLPDCLVSDSCMPWTFDVTSELGIPRLVFHGTSFFSLCVAETLGHVVARESLPADGESFIVPGLPHRIEMLKSQMPLAERLDPAFLEFFKKIEEVDGRSYGVVVNSFYELESDYAEFYQKIVRRRAWGVGPVSLCNRDIIDKFERGEEASINCEDCLNWLDNKKPGSVVFVCFGTLYEFSNDQFRELALALEASGHPFILVVKRSSGTNVPEWLLEGYEKSIGARGLIIRGWAPQILILNHPAVGVFVTHCGWNSTLEAVSAGVPMVTWPQFAEQFYNERLVVDLLRIGVAIGNKEYVVRPSYPSLVKAAEIQMALARIMGGGEQAQAMKKRAEELGEMAKKAVDEGGSAYNEVGNLIHEFLGKKAAGSI